MAFQILKMFFSEIQNLRKRGFDTLGSVETKKLIKWGFLPLNFLKKIKKEVDRKCNRCYNIKVSRASYALMEVASMLLEELQQAEKRCVGVKQVQKAILRGTASKVYIAKDADERIVESLAYLCEEHKIEFAKVDSMHELGRTCGIHVKAATAAILKA